MVCCMCDLAGEYGCVSISDVFLYCSVFSLRQGLLLNSLFCLVGELLGSACLCLLMLELKMNAAITGFLCGC